MPDTRLCRVTNKSLSNKDFYLNTFRHLRLDDRGKMIWDCAAPLKYKIFVWLARRRRLPTNARRFRHQLSSSVMCPSCPLDEDVDHLLVTCHRAHEVWAALLPADQDLTAPATDLLLSRSQSFEDRTIRIAIAWNIWKRRNALVFNSKDEPLHATIGKCIADVRLWANRCTKFHSSASLLAWCNLFEPP
jgi:hypothetical protein